jgi:hypothetical protein
MSRNNFFRLLPCLVILSFILWSCGNKPVPLIEPRLSADLKDFPLGTTGYHVRLPYHYHLEESRGKEGQLGYSIVTGDRLSTASAFIELKKGLPVAAQVRTLVPGQVFARTFLLDRQVDWRIDSLETGYFEAFTYGSGDLSARISSRDRQEIDWMVSLIATLRKS